MGCSESSVFLKISLVVVLLGLIFHIIGISTSNWSTSYFSAIKAEYGLWKYCISNVGIPYCTKYADITLPDEDYEWIKSCQAMGILGVLVLVAAFILNILCVTVFNKQNHKAAFILALILAFLGAVCVFITNIVWGVKSFEWSLTASTTDMALSWSFALSLTGGIIGLLGGVLIGVGFIIDTKISVMN